MKNSFLQNYLTKSEQKILSYLLIVTFAALLIEGIASKTTSSSEKEIMIDEDTVTTKVVLQKYDLNIITKAELISLPNIGEQKAQAIIDLRASRGKLSFQDLRKVKGIGPKTLNKLKVYFFDSKGSSVVQSNLETTKSDTLRKNTLHKSVVQKKINLNKATLEELMSLKGIGKKRAEDILEYRKLKGNFKSVQELDLIKGIGAKTIANISDNITVED